MIRYILLAITVSCLTACGPDYGMVARQRMDKIIKLEDQNAALQADLKNRDATIADLKTQLADKTPRLATLPEDRLNQIILAQRVELQHSTDASDFDTSGPQQGYRVYFRPMSDSAQPIAATGTLTIEAFDLALTAGTQRIGQWTFLPQQLKGNWYSSFGLNHFAVNCPWNQPPAHEKITFKITFVDAMTGRIMTDQALVRVHLKK